MTIKAIQTQYKGYHFRSRLEARWAVFFDALGLEWEYEPEGFELGDGVYYLPDFYLPKLKAWVEVKGGLVGGSDLSRDDKEKVMRFANSIPWNQSLTVVSDFPKEGKELVVTNISNKHGAPSGVLTSPSLSGALICELCFIDGEHSLTEKAPDNLWRFVPENIEASVMVIPFCNSESIERVLNKERFKDSRNDFLITNYHVTCNKGFGDVMEALTAARSARFEHGDRQK